MDSARFIRRRRVFIMWISVPLLLAGFIHLTAHGFKERQKIKFNQAQTLEQMIPQMTQAAEEFNQFIAPYKVIKNTQRSIEDENIELLNKAAEKADVTITSINLAQKVLNSDTGTVRMSLQIKGSGTDRGLSTFLNQIRIQDPFIYEDRVIIAKTGINDAGFQIEASLSKIYTERPGEL
jgi:hypothetical protein